MSRIFIGVDVCKDFLDAYARPTGVQQRFDNTPAGIEQLILWVRPFAPQRIVFESTGPYQKAAVGALLAADLPAVVVNARQVRDFAKGTGQLAKTDVIDARILAHFGEVVDTVVRPLPPQEILEFREFCDRRGQLVRMLAAEKNHRHAAQGGSPKVLKNIDKHIAFLKRQIDDLEVRMDRVVAQSEAFKARASNMDIYSLGCLQFGDLGNPHGGGNYVLEQAVRGIRRKTSGLRDGTRHFGAVVRAESAQRPVR